MNNIFNKTAHLDERGIIADILYNTPINHVTFIQSEPGSVRGNHYHKETTQYTFIVSGAMNYYTKSLNNNEINKITLIAGDVIKSPPNEIHAMKFLENTVMIVFTEGVRGGIDYEKDTFRVESIIWQ